MLWKCEVDWGLRFNISYYDRLNKLAKIGNIFFWSQDLKEDKNDKNKKRELCWSQPDHERNKKKKSANLKGCF